MINFWQKEIPYVWHPKLKTKTWFCSDSEENFKNSRDQLHTADTVSYTFNEYGYRIGPSDWNLNSSKKRLLALGCSHTVGVGVPWDDTWPVLLAKHADYELFNLASSGSAGDVAVRTLYSVVDIIKPDLVAILWPEVNRYEFYENFKFDADGDEYELTHSRSIWNDESIAEMQNHLYNLHQKNLIFLDMMQQLYKFKCLTFDSMDVINDYARQHSDILYPVSYDSRDKLHPGVQAHQYIAKKFIDTY